MVHGGTITLARELFVFWQSFTNTFAAQKHKISNQVINLMSKPIEPTPCHQPPHHRKPQNKERLASHPPLRRTKQLEALQLDPAILLHTSFIVDS